MIIIKLKGGLGNQMFQYAYGRNISHQQKIGLRLNKSLLKNTFWQNLIGTTQREYELDQFNIKSKLTTDNKNSFEGWWQNEKYFLNIRNILIKDFTLKKESKDYLKLKKIIINSNSVSIHIRRGDYAKIKKTKKYHGLLPISYYKKAITLIDKSTKNPKFFIFSDDIDWVKNNFKIKKPFMFIDKTYKLSDAEELILMSFCLHNIIANSSFSWWGAWLNKNPKKIVIAPKQWFKSKVENNNETVPNSWIKI